MYQFAPGGVKFKIFVKETDKTTPTEQQPDIKYFRVSPLTGDKAKEFYEDVLKEPPTTEGRKCPAKRKPKSKPPAKGVQSNFKNSDLLRMAQNNDVKNLNRFLAQKTDPDLNVVDDYGWTPLMCASCSGAEEAVEWLLENGADPQVCDKLGNTALKLARRNNQKRIVERLENYKNEPEPEGENLEESGGEPFFCTTCRENVTVRRANHESSTLHLFNCRLKTSTYYAIPECNKGFQLLLRKGWDREKGLGRDGTGRKFPVKAVVKKDRLGIGAPAPPPGDRNKGEVRHTEKYESKKRKVLKRSKEKDFEKNFRLEFS